jgi:hypothetical protein
LTNTRTVELIVAGTTYVIPPSINYDV